MNEFLKTRSQIESATKWLKENGYTSHPISCKDYELMKATQWLKDGSLLDMGADGSFVLHNAIIKETAGRKVGIDLAEVTGDNKANGAEYFVEDLMATSFMDGEFNQITCCSVLEHAVGFDEIAKECGRLLSTGGKLFISFDYWPEKVNTDGITLYGLKWNILDMHDVLELVEAYKRNGLELTSEIDWAVQDKVINPRYCAPANVEYTFGLLEFIKI